MLRTVSAKEWPADSPNVSYEGRTIVGKDHQVMMGFPGIVTRLRVNSSTVRATIDASSDDVYFNLVVDGEPPRRLRLRKGSNDVVLLEGANPGIHTIELLRRTESWEGVCEIRGFSTEGGDILAPAQLPARKLLFIGDSVTCGEGTEPSEVPDVPGAERSNAAASFAVILARRLGAQYNLVSYGGRGMIRDWQGIRTTNNAPSFYELALPDGEPKPWNHQSYIPDGIGVCLGTNDFSQGVPDENEFVNGYVEFLRKMMSDFPHAAVVLIDSPILDDPPGEVPKKSVCRAYLEEIARRMGLPRVHLGWVSHYHGIPGDGHPVAAEHILMANELEPVFRRALAWI